MLNSPQHFFFYEAYVKHFALSDQFWLLVFSHVLKFLSINLFAEFLIVILIKNVLKKALNNFRGHITAKKKPQKAKSCDSFLIAHFGLQHANAGRHSPLGYAIDCKFGFDFGSGPG